MDEVVPKVHVQTELGQEIYLVLGSGLENPCKGSEIVKNQLADVQDLFFAPPVGVG